MTTRNAILGHVSHDVVHTDDDSIDEDCTVEVLALANGGSARTLVRCLFTGVTAHVAAASVRP